MKKTLIFITVALIAVGLWRFSSRPVSRPQVEVRSQTTKVKVSAQVASMPALINTTQKYSTQTSRKLRILEEVFASRNDNDPRLDSEFKELTPEMKEALVTSYKATPKEMLNERGTLIFLLGNNIESQNDLEFFQDLLNEAPCLSLSDCSAESKPINLEDDHSSEMQSATLVYPQLVALRLVSAKYQKTKDSVMKERMQELFKNAQASHSEYISDESERIANEAGIKN
jgi:hypothetical protein